MNRIHRKSAIPQSTEIILSAHERGEGLLWERYEQQLPLCAFTNNGLNCRKCLNGPCRVNPFGDEPRRGVCGADRDQVVMENLFHTTMEGVLETARSLSSMKAGGSFPEIPDITSDLPSETQKRLSNLSLLPVRKHQIFEIQNSYFSHKGYLSETLMGLTRLGLIHYGLLKEGETYLSRLPQNGESFHPGGVNLLLAGQGSLGLLQSLRNHADRRTDGRNVNIFVQEGNVTPLANGFADHGTPELALAMNLDALIITPNASLPALEGLAKRFDIPIILMEEGKSLDQISIQAIEQAVTHARNGSNMTPSKMVPAMGQRTQHLFERGREVRGALERGQLKGVVVILGEANVKQTFFERTLTLIKNCLAERCLVLVGDELGAHGEFLNGELSKVMTNDFLSRADSLPPLAYFGPGYEIPKVVTFLRDLTHGKGFDTLPAVIAFPEFYRASSWAKAVSFLSMGFAVQIGTHLPFWGSPSLTEVLTKDWPKVSEGVLMARASVPDGQTQADELLSFLETRKVRQG
jgi:hypothetical protein